MPRVVLRLTAVNQRENLAEAFDSACATVLKRLPGGMPLEELYAHKCGSTVPALGYWLAADQARPPQELCETCAERPDLSQDADVSFCTHLKAGCLPASAARGLP
jgi:hypothetical protein